LCMSNGCHQTEYGDRAQKSLPHSILLLRHQRISNAKYHTLRAKPAQKRCPKAQPRTNRKRCLRSLLSKRCLVATRGVDCLKRPGRLSIAKTRTCRIF
jgi:hypothetical protein